MANRLPFSGEEYWSATSRTSFAGAKMYTYADQSRTTDKATYTTAAANVARTNPIVADANGIFPEIYGTGEYFIDIKSSDDSVTIYQADNIYPYISSAGTATVVELLADLKALNTTDYQNAWMLGTSAINDGGQAQYYFDSGSSAAPNNTSVVQPNVGTGRWLVVDIGDLGMEQIETYLPMGLEWKTGLVYTPNVSDLEHDIDIAAGSIMDSTNTVRMNISAITKRIDATWAAGTNAGGLSDDDSLGNATWYGLFVLTKANGDSDAIFATTKARSLSDAAATAAGFIYSRLIGYVLTDGSANITRFIYNNANQYLWHSLNTQLFSEPSQVGVPVAVPVPPYQTGLFGGRLSTTSATTRFVRFTASQQANDAAAAGNADIACESDGTVNQRNDTHFSLYVGVDRTIRYRCSHTANTTVRINTLGYINDTSMTDLV